MITIKQEGRKRKKEESCRNRKYKKNERKRVRKYRKKEGDK